MIEKTKVDGREATVAYIDTQGNPTERDSADAMRVLFDNGDRAFVYLRPKDEVVKGEDEAAINCTATLPLDVKKSEARQEQRIVWGEVYAPNRPDSGGDYMTAEDIRAMAHDFVRKGQVGQVDVMHDNRVVPGVSIVESFIARDDDPTFIPGSWVVGCHIPDDDLWEKVRKGQINGFSMEALVQTEDREVEVEIPEVITGSTSEHADHCHKFEVRYDENGKFLGGETDEVNGHKHAIKAGTVTEDGDGHTHRFSSVDSVFIVNG